MIQNAHIICYSGGEASALAAIEVSRKHCTKPKIQSLASVPNEESSQRVRRDG